MRRVSAVGVGLALLWAATAFAAKTASADRELESRLESALTNDRALHSVRLEVVDGERRDPESMVVYGSGVGIWEHDRQFQTSEKQVRKALRLLERSGFPSMPDRVKGPRPADAEEGGEPDATVLVRFVTLTVGGLTKTVVQDNKAYPLESFEDLCRDLVKIFRKAARHGVEASSLDDGLAKLAAGTLAPEVLHVLVSAPEQRALPSQEGQGWLLTVQDGEVDARAHTLESGFGPEVRRPLTPELARQIAGWLREADISSLPQNVYDTGYTDLSVAVLGHEKSLQAREFAGRDPAAEVARRERFRALRVRFQDLAKSMLGG